jgi:hypothetical protein
VEKRTRELQLWLLPGALPKASGFAVSCHEVSTVSIGPMDRMGLMECPRVLLSPMRPASDVKISYKNSLEV